MTPKQFVSLVAVGAFTAAGACAPQPEPAPTVIYAEPVFDKFGNPSCRPGDVPIGGAYTVDLPLCPVIGGGTPVVVVPAVDGDENGNGSGTVVVDPNGGNQNRNQEQNRNQNQNQNQNQAGN